MHHGLLLTLSSVEKGTSWRIQVQVGPGLSVASLLEVNRAQVHLFYITSNYSATSLDKMSSKIEKTLQRQREKYRVPASCHDRDQNADPARIAEGQFYEAHQQLRVVASRYTKAQDWDNATSILYSGAQSLLQAGQGGSGGDLCIFLLDVFNKGEVKPDANSKGKLLSLLRSFPRDEPTKKKFIGEMIAWSSKYGEYPAGDPDIHHVAGSQFADGMTQKFHCFTDHGSDFGMCRA